MGNQNNKEVPKKLKMDCQSHKHQNNSLQVAFDGLANKVVSYDLQIQDTLKYIDELHQHVNEEATGFLNKIEFLKAEVSEDVFALKQEQDFVLGIILEAVGKLDACTRLKILEDLMSAGCFDYYDVVVCCSGVRATICCCNEIVWNDENLSRFRSAKIPPRRSSAKIPPNLLIFLLAAISQVGHQRQDSAIPQAGSVFRLPHRCPILGTRDALFARLNLTISATSIGLSKKLSTIAPVQSEFHKAYENGISKAK
ncbi:hypothetical protein KSP40_PGU005403 [Platanthera guangdongensis]|uniref:Uncharacterized protein n=1 Tax=Platanthera guangdongensis TaxID=2320717 RepID=A0ABR2LLJ1_9ASPA